MAPLFHRDYALGMPAVVVPVVRVAVAPEAFHSYMVLVVLDGNH